MLNELDDALGGRILERSKEVCATKESTIEKLAGIIERACQQEMYRYILVEKIYQNKILAVNTVNDKKTKN